MSHTQSDAKQFVDYCAWESLEDAVKAAQEVRTITEFQSFFAMIDTVIYFDHIKPLD